MRLKDKTVFITGAAGGIGRAASALFAREGAKVVMADIDLAGQKLADDLCATGARALFIQTDITQEASVAAAMTAAIAQFGGIDVLYNNAGGSRPGDGPVATGPEDEFWRALRVDLYGTWLCCRHAIPAMQQAGRGAIVNTSSMVATIGWPGKTGYTAAKGGISALTRSMAIELGPLSIRVNAVAPGVTLSDRIAGRLEAGLFPESLVNRHILGPLMPEDIARAALFLACDDSAGMTGHVMAVDHGATIA